MNYEAIKVRLHDYIEHADHEKVMAIYTLPGSQADEREKYDNTIIADLEARRDDIVSGREKTYTLEQTIENLLKRRKQHGV